MIGRLMRKLNTAADSRENRNARPAVMVLPDRDTPGMMANICANPISAASIQVMAASGRS